MSLKKSQPEKTRLHARNRNRGKYDLSALVACTPELANYIKPNKLGEDSVDFAKPEAVKLLNKALLNHYYSITNWDIPAGNLCPPVPGRADYIHHIADLLSENSFGTVPKGKQITCLDIGIGANCIYPIIGVVEYDWKFIGTDIHPKSIEIAQHIVKANSVLKDKIDFRLQEHKKQIFEGIIDSEDKIDVSICNPPFHSSTDGAQKASRRKIESLSRKRSNKPITKAQLNFAGMSHELTCEGGEHRFIHNMIRESKKFSKNCFWFSTLVSKQSNLKGIYKALEKIEADQVRTIPLGTGNKTTRIVAWTLLTKEERKAWRE